MTSIDVRSARLGATACVAFDGGQATKPREGPSAHRQFIALLVPSAQLALSGQAVAPAASHDLYTASRMPDSGWFTLPMMVLALQAIAAAVAVRVFAARVAPHINSLHSPAGVLDSLGPFALALPLICAAWRTQWEAAPTAWLVVGAPIAVAFLAVGGSLCVAAIIIQPDNHASLRRHLDRVSPAAGTAWSVVGAILIMLGAAHHLTVWIGQSAFALGAVLLWMNTPEIVRDDPDDIEARAGGGLTIVLLCALVHCAAMFIVPAHGVALAGGIVIAQATMMAMLTAGLASPAAAMRLGGWTAAYGVLLGLGAMSLRHLLPRAFDFAGGDRTLPPLKVAYGFGAFAYEATALLILGATVFAVDRIHARQLRLAVGAAVFLAAAVLTAWRLASL